MFTDTDGVNDTVMTEVCSLGTNNCRTGGQQSIEAIF